MIVRRVVTGRAADGSSVVRMDGQPPRVVQLPSFPDFCGAFVWSTSGVPGLSGNIEDPTPGDASFVPAPGKSGAPWRAKRVLVREAPSHTRVGQISA